MRVYADFALLFIDAAAIMLLRLRLFSISHAITRRADADAAAYDIWW